MKRKQGQPHRSDFELFKSAICHRVKDMGDIDFIIDTLESGEIRTFYERQWYPECLYLLAMLDHISKLNDIPLCSDFDDLHRQKLSRVIYPRDVLLLCALYHNDDAKSKQRKTQSLSLGNSTS